MPFPIHRKRRLRATDSMRRLVRETWLEPSQFVLPLFVCPGENVRKPISSMPGHAQQSVDLTVKECLEAEALGVGGVILFGIPAEKDECASGGYAEDGIVQQAIRAIKAECKKIVVITDVCNCEYTSHGHCGKVVGNDVDNDPSLVWLADAALSHARAGADIVAPSDMMDGRVAAIRATLDASGHSDTALMSYSTKFASAFYGPFREAADSAPKSGDRKSYQMDHRNGREALRESLLDEQEGADILMVKPALSYLDVIRTIKDRTLVPLAAYNVSGEYSMVKAAAAKGWVDEKLVVREILNSMFRAGADLVISYHGREAREKGWI